jgi:hypothetical protein
MMKVFAAGLIGAAVLVGAPASAAQKVRFTLPEPTGHHQVGTTMIHFVDHARPDPWKPDRKRELMISVWYPAKHANHYPRAQWLSDGLVPSVEAFAAQPGVDIPQGSIDWTHARTAGRVGAPADRTFGGRPVVLYSPGLGGPRSMGTVQAQDLASHGYVVVTIDHTYETTVEFPGGRVEPAIVQTPTPDYLKAAIDARVADTRFVLDRLPQVNRELGGALNLGKVGMFGHSYGGFTAGETMVYDRRIKAGMNLDGQMGWGFGRNGVPYLPGEVVKRGLDRPFKLMGAQFIQPDGTIIDHSPFNDWDRSWFEFWANQRGWKQDVALKGAGHNSFSDMQVVLPQLTGPLGFPAGKWVPIIGTIDPGRSVAAQNINIRSFFDRFL